MPLYITRGLIILDTPYTCHLPISVAAPTLSTTMPPNPTLPQPPQPPSPQPHPAIHTGPSDSLPANIVPSSQDSPRSSAGWVCFIWGEVNGAIFDSKLASVYDIVIHWKPNLRMEPLGIGSCMNWPNFSRPLQMGPLSGPLQ